MIASIAKAPALSARDSRQRPGKPFDPIDRYRPKSVRSRILPALSHRVGLVIQGVLDAIRSVISQILSPTVGGTPVRRTGIIRFRRDSRFFWPPGRIPVDTLGELDEDRAAFAPMRSGKFESGVRLHLLAGKDGVIFGRIRDPADISSDLVARSVELDNNRSGRSQARGICPVFLKLTWAGLAGFVPMRRITAFRATFTFPDLVGSQSSFIIVDHSVLQTAASFTC
nr:hypothetical protein [Rhizobium sp. P38BS-XIX]